MSQADFVLLNAARRGPEADILRLIREGGNVDATDRGISVLQWVICRGLVNCLEELLARRVILGGHTIPILFHTMKRFGVEPLHSHRCLELLIEAGVDVNSRSPDDPLTPLHAAVKYNDKRAIVSLIAAGADLYAINREGQTPYDIAIRWRHERCAEVLLAAMLDAEVLEAVDHFRWL